MKPVREPVARLPSTSSPAAPHQIVRRVLSARYAASGNSIVSTTLSSIGCADERHRADGAVARLDARVLERQHGDDALEVVEHVERRRPLEHRQQAEDRAAGGQHAQQAVDGLARADEADDQVEHQHEAREEAQRLDGEARQLGEAPRVDELGAERRDHDQRERSLEPARAPADARVDQQRREPRSDQQRDDEPVRLDVDGQRRGQLVLLDRQEEDHQQRPGQQDRPAQQHPVPRGEHRIDEQHQRDVLGAAAARQHARREQRSEPDEDHRAGGQPARRRADRRAHRSAALRRRQPLAPRRLGLLVPILLLRDRVSQVSAAGLGRMFDGRRFSRM